MGGTTTIRISHPSRGKDSPRISWLLVQSLLVACNSIKVRRLFLYLAEQHQHPWFERLDLSAIDLGVGNRSIVSGGRLDSKYQITVPANLGVN